MKKFILNIIFLFSISLNSQELTKSEFDQVKNNVFEVIDKTISTEDFDILIRNLNFFDSTAIKKVKDKLDKKYSFIKENKDKNDNYILPFFTQNKKNKTINLTVYSFSITDDKDKILDKAKLDKAKYFFILETEVLVNENKEIKFQNSKIFVENKDIKYWFLDRFDDYMNITNPIYDKYQFIPPPPPPIPNFIDYSPMHYDDLLFTKMEKNMWKDAEDIVNKLVDYYPLKGRYYHLRAYVSYHLKKDYCNDLKKAVKNGILKEEPKLKYEIEKMLTNCSK